MTVLRDMTARGQGEQGRWAKWSDSDLGGRQGGQVSREKMISVQGGEELK